MKWQETRKDTRENVSFALGAVVIQLYTFNPPGWEYHLKIHCFLAGAWWPPKHQDVEVFRHHQTRSARLRQIIREWPKWLDEHPQATAWVMEELL